MKISIRTNLWAGIAALVSAVAIWFLIPGQIASSGDDVASNPRLFPQIFTVITGVAGLILIVSSLVFGREEVRRYSVRMEGKKFAYYLLIAAYVISMPHFGFLIPSLVFTVLTLLCLGCGKPAYYAWALAFVAVLYYAFSKIIGVFFP